MEISSSRIRKRLFILVALLSMGLPLHSDNLQSTTTAKARPTRAAQFYSRWSALWRSALIPGWGQWYRGDRAWGAGYLGSVALTGGISYYYLTQGNSSYTAYQNATNASDASSLYSQTINDDNLHQAFGYTAVGLYALNLADALLIKRVRSTKAGAFLPGQAALVADGHGGKMMVFRWEL
jgi:hypothetical protein